MHFSGHGISHQGMLCFEDGFGATHLLEPGCLRDLLHSGNASADFLQVVFVSSCHSELVASVFVDAGIRHVIAVRKKMITRYIHIYSNINIC